MQFSINGTEYHIERYDGLTVSGWSWTTKKDECAGYFTSACKAQQNAIDHEQAKIDADSNETYAQIAAENHLARSCRYPGA